MEKPNWLNLLHFMWIFYSSVIAVFGMYLLHFESKTPFLLLRLFKFGKLGKNLLKEKSFTRFLEVPKRYFGHFYVFASIYFFLIVLEVWRRYFIGSATPFVTDFLDFFTTKDRKSLVPPESVLVLSFLLLLQACRRCFECYYVSVYSDGKMNIMHYVVGFTFYLGAGQSLLCAAPGFETSDRSSIQIKLSSDWLTLKHFVGIALFLFGFVLQYQANFALANLRKDDKGTKVVTLKHVMPSGGWFDLISCPHYFAEIVIYFSANIIFDFQNTTWWLLCLWVATNQIVIGLFCHQWYRKTFKDYPPSRKAIIPYLL